jgi:hypothetical protein
MKKIDLTEKSLSEQYERLSDDEKSNIATFSSYAKRFAHRIALPLSKDLFTRGLQARLEHDDVKFARVPFQSIDTVYYFFRDLNSVKLLVDFVAEAAPKEFAKGR